MAVNQIQKRKQIDPHDINEVPIQAHNIHGRVPLRCKSAGQRSLEQPEQAGGPESMLLGKRIITIEKNSETRRVPQVRFEAVKKPICQAFGGFLG
jgi:hypothetical protein